MFNTIFGGPDGAYYFVTCLGIVCYTAFSIAVVLAKAIRPKKIVTETDGEEDDEDEDDVIEVLDEIKSLLIKHNELIEEQTEILEEIRDAVVKPETVAPNQNETK